MFAGVLCCTLTPKRTTPHGHGTNDDDLVVGVCGGAAGPPPRGGGSVELLYYIQYLYGV